MTKTEKIPWMCDINMILESIFKCLRSVCSFTASPHLDSSSCILAWLVWLSSNYDQQMLPQKAAVSLTYRARLHSQKQKNVLGFFSATFSRGGPDKPPGRRLKGQTSCGLQGVQLKDVKDVLSWGSEVELFIWLYHVVVGLVKRRVCSKSRSWPIKLKLGEMSDFFILTMS